MVRFDEFQVGDMLLTPTNPVLNGSIIIKVTKNYFEIRWANGVIDDENNGRFLRGVWNSHVFPWDLAPRTPLMKLLGSV